MTLEWSFGPGVSGGLACRIDSSAGAFERVLVVIVRLRRGVARVPRGLACHIDQPFLLFVVVGGMRRVSKRDTVASSLRSACILGYVDIGKLPFVLADFADGARAAADALWWNVPLLLELAGFELYRSPSADLICPDRLFFGDCVFVDSWSGHLG